MKENVFRQTIKKVEEIEKTHGSLENYVIASTFGGEGHRMRMEEDYSSISPLMTQVYQDLYLLELADLYDWQNFVGGFDGDEY